MENIKVDPQDIERYVNKYNACPRRINMLVDYVEKRWAPGDALTGMLENDLRKCLSHADTGTLADLDILFKFVYNVLPMYCWGSQKKVKAFLEG